MDHKIALENLITIRDILTRNNVSWWLDGGTCLGAFREKDFIAIDTDTDIGVLEETYKDSITQEIVDAGFEIHETFGTRDKGYQLAFVKNGVKVDIFFYYLKDDKRWYAMWNNKMIPMVYPAYIFEKQQVFKFLGHPFPFPFEVEYYLRTKYGDDYMIPHTEVWEWWHGPKNIDLDFIK